MTDSGESILPHPSVFVQFSVTSVLLGSKSDLSDDLELVVNAAYVQVGLHKTVKYIDFIYTY